MMFWLSFQLFELKTALIFCNYIYLCICVYVLKCIVLCICISEHKIFMYIYTYIYKINNIEKNFK